MVSHFCCCCNLRSGCIAFAWLHLMSIVLIIAGLSSTLVLLDWNIIDQRNYGPIIHPIFSVIIAMQVIKCFTCVALTWGIVKYNHMFYQPWLFIQGTENAIVSLGLAINIFAGISAPQLLILVLPIGFINGLSWYFWACIYTVYKKDALVSMLPADGQYDTITMTSSLH